jgi:hypothetical protein
MNGFRLASILLVMDDADEVLVMNPCVDRSEVLSHCRILQCQLGSKLNSSL